MKTIGGFLPLEVGDAQSAYHCGAAAMSTGRAGWHAILLARRPARVRLPFYICDAAIQPLVATGTPFEFYPIDERFRPLIVPQDDDDIHLVVNYFGLLRPFVDRLASGNPVAVVVDDSQAFFRKGLPGACSFNSARKFFGVPDGSYVYGIAPQSLLASDLTDCQHLITRLEGEAHEAWQQFKRHEARIGIEPRAMSAVSARLLAAVDMMRARKARAINFDALHRRLGPLNRIALTLDGAEDGPMCYPFLPSALVDRTTLAAAGLFVPALWPDVAARDQAGFDWERDVAERLLPLPIDHRYTPADMETVADRLLQVLA
jgi:hypothetical protein